MYLFKTSGETFESVIINQKHAFASQPSDWHPGEIVLVSKNKLDCRRDEKQIQYIMRLVSIKRVVPGEIEKLWPGNEGRWEYIVSCENTTRLSRPFNLFDVLGPEAEHYRPVVTYVKIKPEHEKKVLSYLESQS